MADSNDRAALKAFLDEAMEHRGSTEYMLGLIAGAMLGIASALTQLAACARVASEAQYPGAYGGGADMGDGDAE